jgi:hypothetical protein
LGKLKKLDRVLLIKLAIFSTLCIEVTNGAKDIYFPIYGNVIGFVFLFLLFLKNFKNSLTIVILNLFLFIFYFLINPTYFLVSTEPYKALFYIIIAVLFSSDLNKYNYNEILYSVLKKYLILIILLFFLGFGIDQAGYAIRIQGLMSEPSALSFILCFLLLKSVQIKEYKIFILTIFVSLLTFSISVYIHIFLIYLFKIFQRVTVKTLLKIGLITIFLVSFFTTITQIKMDNWLLNKFQDAIEFTTSGGNAVKNTRAMDMDRLFIEQNNSSTSFLLGNGPGYSVYYYQIRDMLTNTHNIFAIIFFDFGLIGLFSIIILFVFSFYRLSNSIYFDLFICILTYSLINTASGIVNEIYLYILIFYSLKYFNLKNSSK